MLPAISRVTYNNDNKNNSSVPSKNHVTTVRGKKWNDDEDNSTVESKRQRRERANHVNSSNTSNPNSPPLMLPPIENTKSKSLASLPTNSSLDAALSRRNGNSNRRSSVTNIVRSMSDSFANKLRLLDSSDSKLSSSTSSKSRGQHNKDDIVGRQCDEDHHGKVYLAPLVGGGGGGGMRRGGAAAIDRRIIPTICVEDATPPCLSPYNSTHNGDGVVRQAHPLGNECDTDSATSSASTSASYFRTHINERHPRKRHDGAQSDEELEERREEDGRSQGRGDDDGGFVDSALVESEEEGEEYVIAAVAYENDGRRL